MFTPTQEAEILNSLMLYHANHPKRIAVRRGCSEETVRNIWRRHLRRQP